MKFFVVAGLREELEQQRKMISEQSQMIKRQREQLQLDHEKMMLEYQQQSQIRQIELDKKKWVPSQNNTL